MKKLTIIICIIIWAFLGFNYSFSLNDVCVENKCLWKELFKWVKFWLKWEWENVETITKRKIIENFCKTIYKFNKLPDNSKTSFVVKDSIFLKVLCSSIWIDIWKAKTEIKYHKLSYYNEVIESATKWNPLICKIDNWINTNKDSLNNIDFTCFTKDIFDNIENDLINIATFVAYGGYTSEEWRKKWEKDFFAWWDSPCEDSFLNSEDDEKLYCQHPLTLKYVEELSNQLKQAIFNLNLIDIKPDDIYQVFSVNKWEKNPWAILVNIKDQAYNELYFYSIFLTYYSSVLKQYNISLSLKKATSDVKDITNDNMDDKIIKAKQNILIARKSLKKSFDSLKNIYRSFPIHVWFLCLIEDLNKLSESMTMIYTPIDQLRTKLEHALNEDFK